MHREILDSMLRSPQWEHLGALWSEEERKRLNLVWHRLDGKPHNVCENIVANQGIQAGQTQQTVFTS